MNQSFYYTEMNEPYMRLYRRYYELVGKPYKEPFFKDGRTMPVAIRKDETICRPGILQSSNDWLAFVLMLMLAVQNSDYQISSIIDHCLNLAKRYHYEGPWIVWWNLATYFHLTITGGRKNFRIKKASRGSPRSSHEFEELTDYEIRKLEAWDREVSLFNLYDFTEFLLTQMSQDDLFGNLLRRAASLTRLLKVETFAEHQRRIERRPIRRKIRHRGYDDHGHLPDPQERILREANREISIPPKETSFESLNHVIDWGTDPPLDDTHSEEGGD